MSNSFAEVAVRRAGGFPDPDKPERIYEFQNQRAITSCIDRLLASCADYPGLDGLQRELLHAANVLAVDDLPPLATLFDALKAIATKFENYLQLIAAVKFAQRPEILRATESHVGFFGSSLGGLLLGSPDPKPGVSEEQKAAIPKSRIVQFSFEGKDLACRTYERTRNVRNEVHGAAKLDALQILHRARTVFAAYLFATEQNLNVLSRGLFEYRSTLEHLVERCRLQAPIFVPTGLQPSGERDDDDFDSVDTLAARASRSDTPLHAILLGEPGAGKSTLVFELAKRQAEAVLADPFSDLRIPILIEASRVTDRDDLVSLASLELNCAESELVSLASEGRVLFLIDGLNEVAVRLLGDTKNKIRNLATRHPRAGYVVTSRFHAITEELNFSHWQLDGFSSDQVREYLCRAFGDEGRAGQFFAELRDIPRLFELCRNPLLLWMLTDLSRDKFHVPTNRGRLLRDFLERFLERERPALAPIEPYTMHRILSYVAYAMRTEGAVLATRERILGWMDECLDAVQSGLGVMDVYRAALAARLLRESQREHVSFFHELVQEYFAAVELCRRHADNPDILNVPEFQNANWWREVIVLFFGLVEKQEPILSAISAQNVAVSAACVMDSVAPDPQQQSRVVLKASSLLSESAASTSPQAFEALALVWTDEARRCVLDAMGTRQQLRDFLTRFSSDTLTAATDLLQTELSARTIGAVAEALKARRKHGLDDAGAERLGVTLVAIVGQNLQHLQEDLRRSLARLIKYAKLPQDRGVRQAARTSVRRSLFRGLEDFLAPLAMQLGLLSEDPSFDYELLTRCLKSERGGRTRYFAELLRQTLAESSLPESALQDIVARLIVDKKFALAQSTLPQLRDRSWLRPFMPLLAEDILHSERQSVAGVRQLLESVLRPEEVVIVFRGLINRFLVAPSELAAALSIVGDSGYSCRARVDYFNHFLDLEAYDEAARALQLVPRRLFDKESYLQTVRNLHAKGQLWIALDLVHKLRAEEDFSSLLCEGTAQVIAAFSGTGDAVALQHAYGWIWSHLPEEVRSTLLNRMLEGRLFLARIDACSRPARIALAHAILTAEEQGRRIAVDVRAARRLGIETQLRKTRERDAELAVSGQLSDDIAYMSGWSISLPSIIEVDHERITNGNAGLEELKIAYRMGAISDSEVGEWFDACVERKDVTSALGVLGLGERGNHRARAVIGARALLDCGEGIAAAQLISGFDLSREFLPEIVEIIPKLLDAGKIGIATSLSAALGPEYAAEFSHEFLGAAESALRSGNAARAITLITQCGFSMLEREFRKLAAQVLLELAGRGDASALQSLFEEERLVGLLEHDTYAAVLGTGKVGIVAVVRTCDVARGLCVLSLPHKWGTALLMLHRPSKWPRVGGKLRVWLRSSGQGKYRDRYRVIRYEEISWERSGVPNEGGGAAVPEDSARADDSVERFVISLGRGEFLEATAILADKQETGADLAGFTEAIHQFFTDAIADGRRDAVESLLAVPKLASLLDRKRVRDALRKGLLWIVGTISRVDPRGFAIVDLPYGLGSGLLHRSADFDQYRNIGEGMTLAVQLEENRGSPARPDRFNVRTFRRVSVTGLDAQVDEPAKESAWGATSRPLVLSANTGIDNGCGGSPVSLGGLGRHASGHRGRKPINAGQIRLGTLCVEGSQLAVRFEDDERVAVLENSRVVPGGLSAAGRLAEFYIRSASKRSGVIARFDRFLDGREEHRDQ